MQKYDFQYKQHELDALNERSIYENSYDAAISKFIDWVHQHGYIGYFDDKTVIGNPANRDHTSYSGDLMHAQIECYVVQYTLLNYYHNTEDPTEEKKVQLFVSEEIDAFIQLIRELQHKGNVKNLMTYKGTLCAFDLDKDPFK